MKPGYFYFETSPGLENDSMPFPPDVVAWRPGGRYIFFANGFDVFAGTSIVHRSEPSDPGFVEWLTKVGGLTRLASRIVPMLLETRQSFFCADLPDVSLLGHDMIEGKDYYRIYLVDNGWRYIIWIDANEYIIIKWVAVPGAGIAGSEGRTVSATYVVDEAPIFNVMSFLPPVEMKTSMPEPEDR